MTELTFLISLLLNEKLPLELKQTVAERIKDVEQSLTSGPFIPNHSGGTVRGSFPQAPVVQATDVAIVAQTPAAAQALASRAQAIAQAASGKAEAGRTSPRKF